MWCLTSYHLLYEIIFFTRLSSLLSTLLSRSSSSSIRKTEMQANQSNVSTKLKKHDFVIPEIEVTSQLIDLRSSATLCWSVEVRPWPCRRWQFEGTVVSNVSSGVWHLDYILITWPTRRSRRLRIVRLKGINLARWLRSAVDIVSGQVMPKTAQTLWRWDASICRHSEGVMGTDSSPYAAIISTVALKTRIFLASLILEMKIVQSSPVANHVRPIFSWTTFRGVLVETPW